MAVSGRSVGLAELFAMAASQGDASDDTPVQRAVEPETTLDLPVQTAPPQPAAPASEARPGARGGPPSGAELEELARRIYEPLSSRLRAELWTDRERAGLLTDVRP